jgi:hypothetical protein
VLLALTATALVVIALLWEVVAPRFGEALSRYRAHRQLMPAPDYDPGRERRAEARASQLL